MQTTKSSRSVYQGQSLVETALVMVLLIIILASIVEFGLMLNAYLAVQDAARNAARYSSDYLFSYRDDIRKCRPDEGGGQATRDFYRVTGCLVNQELALARPQVTLTLSMTNGDDVVVSALSIAGAGKVPTPTVYARFPGEFGEAGWSESLDWFGHRNQSSLITRDKIENKLDMQAPSTGFVAVEIFSHYDQVLKLPWITAFISDPVPLYVYAIMPLVSAEPDE